MRVNITEVHKLHQSYILAFEDVRLVEFMYLVFSRGLPAAEAVRITVGDSGVCSVLYLC